MSSSSVTVTPASNGVVVVTGVAVDVAGNRGAPVNVTWVHDTTPPVVTAAIVSAMTFVPALNASVIHTRYITLGVAVNEDVDMYLASASGDADGDGKEDLCVCSVGLG